MTTAQHLGTIDLLRSRDFPVEPGPSDVGSAGPGYHMADLAGRTGEIADPDADAGTGPDLGTDPGTDPRADAGQRVVEHEALLDALAERWGEPDLFSLVSTQLRAEREPAGGGGPAEAGGDADEEEIPEPWLRLSRLYGWVHLWRIDGLWIAVGLSECRFQAVVTVVDPP